MDVGIFIDDNLECESWELANCILFQQIINWYNKSLRGKIGFDEIGKSWSNRCIN